eukprot:scaffold36183_cov56-Phaeocystis_antarctica.AAC.7
MRAVPSPVLADIWSASSASVSNAVAICARAPCTSAWPRSTLLTMGRMARSCSKASQKLATVCAWERERKDRVWRVGAVRPASRGVIAAAAVRTCTPLVQSTSSSAPWQAAIERETSYEKSTWPGVSMRLSR